MHQIENERLRGVTRDFDAALQKSSEEEIHRVLATNADIFFPGLHSASKFKLADSHVTDFLNVRGETGRSNNPSGFAQLVEIERADYTLFTKSGDPSARLTHAIRQVQDWKRWIHHNRDFFTEL